MLTVMQRRLTMLGLALGNLAIGTLAFVVIGILPDIARDYDIPEARAGLVFTLYAATYAASSPLLIAATGLVPRKWLLCLALGLAAAATLGSALAPGLGSLAATRVVAAMGGAVYTPVAAAVAYALSPPESRGRSLGLVFFGLQVAQAAGVPLGAVLSDRFGWPAAFLLAVGLAGVALPVLVLALPARIVTPQSSLAKFGRAMRDPLGLAAVLVMGLHVAAMMVPLSFIATLAASRGDAPGLVLTLFGLGGVLGGLAAGRLAQGIGPVRARGIALVSQLLLLPLLSLPLVGLSWGSAGFLTVAFLWSLLATPLMIPQQMLLLDRHHDRGDLMLGLNGTANYVGVALGSAIGGGVVTFAGPAALGAVGGVLALAALAAAGVSERLYRSADRREGGG